MNLEKLKKLIPLAIVTWSLFGLSGCSSSGGGSYGSTVHYGGGYYDPWYHDRYYPGGIIIDPPDYPDIDLPVAPMPMDMPMDMDMGMDMGDF
ncbi:MAG: hypothetical protein DRP71_04090 [Verrucomicrobia bacterium]|nr:MAG: hypothetical protein DRP71_04090 [Verrucomicrobiota bacterium]